MNKSSFFIAGQHAVIEALRNPKRKVLRVFLTEDAKKNIHRKNQKKNVLEDVKVFFKSKKELDKYTSKCINCSLLVYLSNSFLDLKKTFTSSKRFFF